MGQVVRRRKSHWKYSLEVVLRVQIWGDSTPNVVIQNRPLSWINMSTHNYFASGSKFTNFFRPIARVVVDNTLFTDFRCTIRSGDVCDQSRKLSKIAPNFGRFLPSQILLVRPFQKLYPRYHTGIEARRLVKFREVTPTNPKVIGVNTLSFKSYFNCSPLNVRGLYPRL